MSRRAAIRVLRRAVSKPAGGAPPTTPAPSATINPTYTIPASRLPTDASDVAFFVGAVFFGTLGVGVFATGLATLCFDIYNTHEMVGELRREVQQVKFDSQRIRDVTQELRNEGFNELRMGINQIERAVTRSQEVILELQRNAARR